MHRFVAGVAVFLTAMQFPGAASHPLAEPQQLRDSYPNLLSSFSAILTPASTPTTPTVISTPSVLSIGATASPILQSIAPPLEPQPSGVVHTSLEYYPQVTTGNPWNRVQPSPAPNVSACRSNYSRPLTPGYKPNPNSYPYAPARMDSSNLFVAVPGNASIPEQITPRAPHPQGFAGIENAGTSPIQTNKFYANMFLGQRNQSVWTHPYSVSQAIGQLAFGPDTPQGSKRYFISPIGIQSLILSATEIGPEANLTLDSLQDMSVNANLSPRAGAPPIITFPLVQGMGFVTAIYKNAQPSIDSGVFYRNVSGPFQVGSSYKYSILLNDGKNWVLYATPDSNNGAPVFSLNTNTTLTGPQGWSGIIQVAKNPAGTDGEAVLDRSAGVYPVSVDIFGSASGSTAQYGFTFGKAGNVAKTLLMYALPHHVQSFDDRWTMVEENVPIDMSFGPWALGRGNVASINSATVQCAIATAAGTELQQDIPAQTNLDSMYFSGKGLAKFATIIYAARDLAGDSAVASQGLEKLKAAFDVFVSNQQRHPLVYDNSWKGVVSSAGYDDPNVDFGNTYYNDHHFHYGYHVYTAAIIGYLDPSWLTERNVHYINTLVRDFANPIRGERFPFSRSFDWFHGHSWAKGLFESADGKDQESSSEDSFASYGLKLWGKVIGDVNMEARASLMLAIQNRSFNNYFLMQSTNAIQPPEIIGNKVTGILFENKIDWATYFSDAWWCKQGIHMIPVHVPSAYIRKPEFVEEEFDTFMSNGRIAEAEGGWRGLLESNLALVKPAEAYDFFADPEFNTTLLDGGASLTWYLAYTAALAGM
ncbi:Glycoside hydrolase family 81 [Lasiodiplodia theobromae]|uniref:Glycoside hydrolase family 81 n=1 Tax=Lasiodiplodia theobromae TaxID=45133 RepID=UPI0015C3C3A1|nr:Glycoside hydrolase family 81 [Lasiodiplodia theobromae]KAF4542219.1 Glycoside hydrolase family 81 [Lasiodiplodia theobromae]